MKKPPTLSPPPASAAASPISPATNPNGPYFPDFFRFEWSAFAHALLAGQPLSPSITEGCKTAFLTDAICRSLRSGGSLIKVDYN